MAHPIADVDYTAPDRMRSNRIHRPLIIATHALHLVSSVIVLSMVAYLLSEFDRDINVEHPNYGRHLLYWLLVAAVGSLISFPALALPAIKAYKGYLAPLTWALSYLWLTAFILAADNKGYGLDMGKVLEAFTVVAFLASIISTLLEARLWDIQRFKHAHHINIFDSENRHIDTFDTEKYHAGSMTATTTDAHPKTSAV